MSQRGEVSIVEVGPRDGLQNEAVTVPAAAKEAFIANLAMAGLKEIEATSFVSPRWVPQLADAEEVSARLPKGPVYWALTPNQKGLMRAQQAGFNHFAFFTAASETFTQRNINMTIQESLDGFKEMMVEARRSQGSRVRAYVSTAFACPYEGDISPKQVTQVVETLISMGVDEISLGDTIGVAAPSEVQTLTPELLKLGPPEFFAYHFHDTRGTGLANVFAALEFGIRRFDSSAAGLGGCPYAPGAGGNLATEDLVYGLERSGYNTGVDLKKLAEASLPLLKILGRSPTAKAQVAQLASTSPSPC